MAVGAFLAISLIVIVTPGQDTALTIKERPGEGLTVAMFHVVMRRSGPHRRRTLEEQSGWPAHASFMDALVDQGFIVLGGARRRPPGVHVVEAESEEASVSRWARPWSGPIS